MSDPGGGAYGALPVILVAGLFLCVSVCRRAYTDCLVTVSAFVACYFLHKYRIVTQNTINAISGAKFQVFLMGRGSDPTK